MKCFGQSSLFHICRLRLHVLSDVDLQNISPRPFICHLKICLPSSGIFMGLQTFILHLFGSVEHTMAVGSTEEWTNTRLMLGGGSSAHSKRHQEFNDVLA